MRASKHTCLFLCLALSLGLLYAHNTAQAFDLNDDLRINGFLSQGYLKSWENNLFGESTDGTFQINEFGLTVNARVSEHLRIGGQLLSRDLGTEGNNEVLLDWGMADYRRLDWLGLRIGKVKLPIGLYNQGRDSDFLRPMAFLPQSVYDENKRNLMVAATGVSLYGNLSLGQSGDLEYQSYYGEINFAEDSGHARGLQALATRIAATRNQVIIGFKADNRYVYGGALVYSPPLSGLRLGASYFTGKSRFTFDLADADNRVSQGYGSGNNKNFLVFSAEYTHSNMTLSAEYMEFTANRIILDIDVPDSRSQGGYVQLSYRLFDPLVASILYDVFYADKDDRRGTQLVARGQPNYLGWRKDLGVGLRWDVTSNWVLKAEWHEVEGAALQLPLFNPQGVKKDWRYLVFKASFNF
jgi:hypothetical protein